MGSAMVGKDPGSSHLWIRLVSGRASSINGRGFMGLRTCRLVSGAPMMKESRII